jgi:sigma-B regulation protein RsbU (phosphoserine phosphatase)
MLCTDGILERRDPQGEFFGLDRVRALVRAHQEATAEEMLERLYADAMAFGNSRPWEDDATAVIVKRRLET